ncbi:MAG: spore germination protein [Candidatus Metalachnospira sp.]|nr:spore germination protein [Candidatus Metalachnospira sp.]
MLISAKLKENEKILKEAFNNCGDIIIRPFKAGTDKDIDMLLVYIDNIVNTGVIQESILTNLMVRTHAKCGEHILDKLYSEAISVGEMSFESDFEKLCTSILLGDTVLFADGESKALIASTKGWPSRGVPEAKTEVVVKGPKDAFAETLSQNIVLVRRRIRDTSLKVVRSRIGRRSQTDVAVMYMEGIVRNDVLNTVKQRLKNIDVDAIIDAGYIEQMTERKWWSPFPQVQMTERPDKAAAALFEGRIVVVVDNSPMVLMLPTTLNTFFQAAEDYYDRWEIMSFVRIIRYIAAFIAISLPGLYVAMTLYNPNLLPVELVLKIAGSRIDVPLSTATEMIVMEIAFELLREAGVRLPSPIGSTLGIVGGIVIGQAAVDAGLIGPMVVIVSAVTCICSFVIPNQGMVNGIRLSKYIVLALSACLGLFGFWAGLIVILIHLCSIESFGVPYMYPYCSAAENGFDDLKDSVIRLPLFMLKKRPIFATPKQRIRRG